MPSPADPAPSPEVLAGQVVMADFDGLEPPARLRDLIRRRSLGGVVLFEKNVRDPGQVADLCAELQGIAHGISLPRLHIAVDQEGGPVERLPLGLPSAMALGAARDPSLAELAGRVTGRALHAVGVTVNFAPVLDVNTNPDNPVIGIRAFGDEPELVTALARAYARGLRRAGVAATGKHFPGHGDTDRDSHLTLPVISHDWARLERVELAPFRALLAPGPDALPAVMTAHVALAVNGAPVPATVSRSLLWGILRQAWGYDGVIVTDSLAMAPIREAIGPGDAAVQALRAGADLLLACGGMEIQEQVLATVGDAVRRGELPVDLLDDAHGRLSRLRTVPVLTGEHDEDDTPDPGEAAERIAAAAVTLVRDDGHSVPLPPGPVHVLSLIPGLPGTDEGQAGRRSHTLGALLRAQGRPATEEALTAGDAWGGSVPQDARLIVVTASRGRPEPWQVRIVERAAAAARDRLVVVATGTPYDLAAFPSIPTYLATYGSGATLAAAARVLTGSLAPRGRLPVSIPGLYTVGHGIVRRS